MPLVTPNVPSGLIDLMKNLAKEVLRDKPQNIYEFAAVHFEKLIQQRDGSLDKDYEQFVAFQEYFNGQQRFAVPANSGYTCQRPIEIQPIIHTKKSKADMLAGFKAMESINEEDVLAETPYSDEKYQKAIYVIQRYYRRYMAQKKNQSSTTLTATTAAIIIQRTMRRLFANKIKLKTNDEDTAKHDGVVQDDVDNVSEAASYTSSSTIQMLADSQEGRENRLPGREVVLSDVSGAADDDGSTEFKEQTTVAQDAALIPPTTDNSEADRKSIADENGSNGTIPQDETTPNHSTPALDDVNVGKSRVWIVFSKTSFHKQDTSTAHIGKLSTIIGSNDQQNSLHTYTVEIDSNSSDPTQIIVPVVAVGITPQSLGAYPNTLPATSPRPHREEHFAVHLQGNAYAENTAANPYQSVAHVRKFDPNTGESLKIYDVFSQDKDDPDFSDSLNESTMERDSLENEDLDVDSLESNENVTHVSGGILRREIGQDNGELYGETNEVHEEEKQDVHQLLELERVPTYLYGIHPSRTPIAERKNKRSRNPSAESVKMRTTKDLDTTVNHGTDDRTPEEKSEEESLESKGSTSEESSVTQIENVSSVTHKIERQGVHEDDLKGNEGASIKMHEVDGVASSNLQKETLSTGKALATNTEEMAFVLEPNPLKSQTDDDRLHKRELLVKKDNSLDSTKVDGDNNDKNDETFEKIVSVINSESVSQELSQTESKSFSQKTSSEKPEIDKSYQPLVVDNTLSKETTLENEDALRRSLSKKPSVGSVESTDKLAHGLAINSSLVSDMKDPGQLQTPSLPLKCAPPLAVGSAKSTVASADTLATNSEASSNASIPSISDKTSDIVSNSNTENLPKDEGFMVELASIASPEGALETHRPQEPDGASKMIEIGTENGTMLDEIETYQANTTTNRRKRSLHDTDTVSVQVPSQTLESVGNSNDQLTRNIESGSNPLQSIETKDPSTMGDVTKKHDPKVETQASSSNSSLGYFATLYNDQNSGGTLSIPGNHDQQVESQLRELQSLTDLYPGLEIMDVMSEFHTRDIQPDDRANDEDKHDDNNNLDAFERSKSEDSRKDQIPSLGRESFIEDSRTIDEKGDSKGEDSDEWQPKELHESSKDTKVKEEVNATKAPTSLKIKTTIDEELKMAEEKVLTKDDEADIKTAITFESLSGLNETLSGDSFKPLDHNSSKIAKGLLKPESDRIGNDLKSDTPKKSASELLIDPTVGDIVNEDVTVTGPTNVSKGMSDKDENAGGNESEISELVTEKHEQMVTPAIPSYKLSDKGHETVKSDEVKPYLKMEAMEFNIFPKPSLAARTESKLQEEDYFGNTIDLNSKILENDNPVIEILKADGVTLKTAGVKLPKVEEEPHDYVQDSVENFDSDMSNAADKHSLTDAKNSESHLRPEKENSSAEIGTTNANEGTGLTDSGKNYKDTFKDKSNENEDPKFKEEGNNEDGTDCKNNMAATNVSLTTKEKNYIENELVSSHDDSKSEKNALADIQPAADLEMSKPSENDVEHLKDRTRLPDALDSYEEKHKSNEKQDSIPNKSEVENKKNDGDKEKMGIKNDNLEKIKGCPNSESGNERLLKNLLASSENVKGESSDVKPTSDEMKEMAKAGFIVSDNSIESRRIEDSLGDNERELSTNKNNSADSLKELKSVELATANEPSLLIRPQVDKKIKTQIESLENASTSLQSETLESKTEDLERNSKSASLADETGVIDSGESLKVDQVKAEQSEERTIDLKDCPMKNTSSFETLGQETTVNPCQINDEQLKSGTSTLAVNIPESSSEMKRLGLEESVPDTNVKPDHLVKNKLHLEHAGLKVCADGYEREIPQPSLTNNNLSLREEIRDDIKLGSKVSMMEMPIGSPGSQGNKSSIVEPVSETNVKKEITVTNLPKLDKQANSAEGQIEAVNEGAHQTEPVTIIESSKADQDGAKKQIEHVNESKGKRLAKADGNIVNMVDSTQSSASVPTEVTSCDDSNAETSADFSSIGKDLDFFEDTINYLKSATVQLTTMDDIFTEDEKDRQGPIAGIVEVESEVIVKPEDGQNQVKELLANRGDDGLEDAKTDVLDQAATVIQSVVRGYRVRRDLNCNVKKSGSLSTDDLQAIKNINVPTEGFQSKKSEDSIESETNIIKKQTPTGVVHPIFVIHPAEEVSGAEPPSKEDSKPLNTETESKILEQKDYETKNQPKPDNIASHPMPPRIAREKPIQLMENSVKHDNLVQTDIDSIGSVRQIGNTIENENKTKTSDEIVKIKASISREKPIERKSKTIKSDSFEPKTSDENDSIDKGQMEPSPGKTKIPIPEKKKIVIKPLNNDNGKPKSKILKSKVPSTSNLLDRERSAKSKRNQFGRKVRSVSMKEQNQKINVFDIEAIKNDLLSTKKVRSSKNSGRRTKMPEQNSNSSIKHSKEPTNSIQKSKKAKGNIDSKELQSSGKGNCDKIDVPKQLFNINDPKSSAVKKLSDELVPVTETSPTVESLKENIDSSRQLSATTIQKNFRGYKARKHLKSVSENEQIKEPDTFNIDISMKGAAGDMPRKTDDDASKNSKPNDSFDTLKREVEDFKNAGLDKSATTIQKSFRGFRTRRSLNGSSHLTKVDEQTLTKKQSSDSNNAAKMHATLVEPHLSEKIMDQKETNIKQAHNDFDSFEDGNNTDLHKSATTIQKNFRGCKARKSLKKAKSFEIISDRTFIIKSKSKETGETLDDDANSGITIRKDQSKNHQVSPKIDTNLSKDEEIGSSAIFENLKRDMESYKNAALDKSAIQIQKTFRGYKTRKYLRNDFTTDKSPREINQISDQTFAVIPKVPKTENKKDSRKNGTKQNEANSDALEADNYNNTDLDESAKTIQRTFRGYKLRKGLKNDIKIGNEQSTNILDDDVKTHITQTKESESKLKEKDDNFQAGNFDDSKSDAEQSPALDEFATTIQKTFRGYKARKELIDTNLKENVQEKNSDANLVELSSSDKMLRSSQPQSGDMDKRLSESVGDEQKALKNASCSEVNHGMKKSSSMEEITSNEVSEKAAITIQKTYKRFKVRKELLTGGKLQQIGNVNSHKNPNNEDAEKSSASSTDVTTKVDIEDSTNSEREYAPDEPAERSTLIKQTIRAASAGALLGAAASTIQKAYRDYHSRKEITISKIKSYSHGAQRDKPPKEANDTSDESSTFIGPDTSFDLSDIDSIGTKSTPTLEQEISNSPSFALSIHSEGHNIENECANTALVSETSLSISPQGILRKRSILDATAPLLVDILNAHESNDSNGKPQWYVGEDLIVPSNETDPSTFQTPLASSSSFDKLSSIDSHFISNLQPTPSINSAVVSTSSLLFDTKDTEMHDTIKNTPKHLNKHSRAVSADEEEKKTEKEAEVKNEVSNCQEIDTTEGKTEKQNVDEEDVFEENGASSHGLTELEASLMLTSTDPFSPRNAIEDAKDASQAIMTELCKNCADGVHEVHEEDITTTSTGGKLSDVELTDKSENQAVNVGDTKDVSQSTDKHFDEIKQFVLMEEELKTAERSSEQDESGQVNETNSNNTETSSLGNVQGQGDNQMTSATSNDDKRELPLVTVNLNDDDTNVGPFIALIPPSSEEETSDRDSTHELEISQSEKNKKDQVNNMTAVEDEKQLEEATSKGADLNECEKSSSEKQQSVDICQEIVTVKRDEEKEADIRDDEVVAVESVENSRDDSPSGTKPSENDADLKAPLKKGTKFEVDSTELKELQNSSEVDGLTDKFEEFPPNGTISENGINVQQKSEDILQESTTTKSHELSIDGAANLPNIETDENATTIPTNGRQCDNEEKNQNVAVGLEEKKSSLGDVSDAKEEAIEETITKNTTELNEEVPNYTDNVEEDHTTSTIMQSPTKESEDSENPNSVDKLNEHSSDLSSNIALDFTEKSEDPLKKKIVDHRAFKVDLNESSNDEAAVEDPIKPIEVSKLSSEVSEVKSVESNRHESQKNEEDNITNSGSGGGLQAVKMRSSSDSSKEENEKPADDVEPLEESKLKSSESSQKGGTSYDIVSENVDKGHVSRSKSNTDEISKDENDIEPATLGEEGEAQIKSQDGTTSEDKTSLTEANSVFGKNELLTTEANFEDLNKREDMEKSIDRISEDKNEADINPKSTHEEITPTTEHEVTESKEVMDINDKHKDPLSPNDSKENLEIATKLLKGCLPNTNLSDHNLGGDKQPSVDNESANASVDVKPTPEDEISKRNSSDGQETLSDQSLRIQEGLDKLIDESVRQIENDTNSINVQDLPVENSPNEVVEVPCVKKVLPPTPLSATSDQDESEIESTTTKAESTTTSPGYDGASDNDALEIPFSLPDSLEAMAGRDRETEEMVARMHQRRASEHKISIEIPDQPPAFDDRISEPIRPMQELQKSSSTEVEDDIILQKLQRGNTTRESSAQSESVVFGDSTSQLTESEDTFNESLDNRTLHRMNTIAVDRSSYKPANLLHKSVTIDDAVKYIDPEKSTEESGGSFSLDDAISADVRKKMMAYSISEADSDYYDAGEPTARLHDDFNISTALDTFPSSDTDITIVSAATKIQAGARGFLTRRRLRRASMGTKSSLNEETKTSFGNDAIGESLDRLIEDEDAKRKPKVQYHRQVGVNSLPSALGNSTETETPTREQIHADDDSDDLKLAAKLTSVAEEIITIPHGEGSSIDGQRGNRNLSTALDNDVNGGQEADDESAQVPPNLEATLAARRLTLQRGDAMRNDSTPDDDNGNAKQVDSAKIIPAAAAGAAAGTTLIHQISTVESTTSGTTPTETTPTTTTTTTTERRNYSDAAMATKMEKIKWFAMRQNSMPVQIDSEVFRVLPKHMRKRIKSAEGEQKKRIRLPRD